VGDAEILESLELRAYMMAPHASSNGLLRQSVACWSTSETLF
jgi:hypothetical protein